MPPKNDTNTIMLMHEIFDAAQENAHAHDRLCKNLRSILLNLPVQRFWDNFYECFMLVFAHVDRSTAEERVVNFICKFLLYVSQTDCNGAYVSSDVASSRRSSVSSVVSEANPALTLKGVDLLNRFITFCLQYHDAALYKTRYRCVQFLRRLLEGMAMETTLSDEVYSQILQALSKRVWDKKASIRAEAVYGLQRLQDPSVADCPVMKTYTYLLRSDPSYEVRKACLMSIALSTQSLAHVLSSTRDISEWVRKQAFIRLTERSVLTTLSISKRIQLLKDGLQDPSQNARAACHTLVRNWHESLNGDSVEFLTKLDVDGEATLCEAALNVVWEGLNEDGLKQQVAAVKDLLDPETLCLHAEKRSGEMAFLWNAMVAYLKKHQRFLDNILPTALHFCEYLKEVFKDYVALVAQREMEMVLERQVLITQSLRILHALDVSDAYSHTQLVHALHDFICHRGFSVSLSKSLITAYKVLVKNPGRFCNDIVTMITEIRDPLENEEPVIPPVQEQQPSTSRRLSRGNIINITDSSMDENVDPIINIKPENGLNEEVQEKSDPLTLLRCNTMAVNMVNAQPALWKLTSSMRSLLDSLIITSVPSQVKGVRQQAVTALGLWCSIDKPLAMQYINLLYTILKMDTTDVQEAALRAIIDIFLVFGLECFEANVPAEPTDNSVLELADSDSEDDSEATLRENEAETTLRNNRSSHMLTKKKLAMDQRIAAKLLRPILNLLDCEEVSLRSVAAQGLAKLVLFNRVVSVKLLSRLLLMWFNPLTETSDPQLHFLLSHILPKLVRVRGVTPNQSQRVSGFLGRTSTFQQNRALNNYKEHQRVRARENQSRLADALFHTLDTLANAPVDSPLSKIDPWNVAELILRLTDSRVVNSTEQGPIDVPAAMQEAALGEDEDNPGHQQPPRVDTGDSNLENPCHDVIAKRLVAKIQEDPAAESVKLWVRILQLVRLSPDNEIVQKDILLSYKRVLPHVKDRLTRKTLERLVSNVEKHLTQKGVSLSPVLRALEEDNRPDGNQSMVQHLDRLMAAAPTPTLTDRGRESLPMMGENGPVLLESQRQVTGLEGDMNITTANTTFFLGSRLGRPGNMTRILTQSSFMGNVANATSVDTSRSTLHEVDEDSEVSEDTRENLDTSSSPVQRAPRLGRRTLHQTSSTSGATSAPVKRGRRTRGEDNPDTTVESNLSATLNSQTSVQRSVRVTRRSSLRLSPVSSVTSVKGKKRNQAKVEDAEDLDEDELNSSQASVQRSVRLTRRNSQQVSIASPVPSKTSAKGRKEKRAHVENTEDLDEDELNSSQASIQRSVRLTRRNSQHVSVASPVSSKTSAKRNEEKPEHVEDSDESTEEDLDTTITSQTSVQRLTRATAGNSSSISSSAAAPDEGKGRVLKVSGAATSSKELSSNKTSKFHTSGDSASPDKQQVLTRRASKVSNANSAQENRERSVLTRRTSTALRAETSTNVENGVERSRFTRSSIRLPPKSPQLNVSMVSSQGLPSRKKALEKRTRVKK